MNKTAVAKELVAVAKELLGARKRKADHGDIPMYINTFNDLFDTRGAPPDVGVELIGFAESAMLAEAIPTIRRIKDRLKRDAKLKKFMDENGVSFVP